MRSSDVDFFNKIREKTAALPAQQRVVCQFILQRYQEVAFMTVEQLAQEAQVGVATVIRAVRSLGFSNYLDLIAQLKEMLIKRESSLWWQLESSWEQNGGNKREELFLQVAQENVSSIQKSCTPELMQAFASAVELMERSDKVAVLGLRSTYGAACYFSSMLMEFRPNVLNVGALGSDSMFAALADLSSKDVLFAMSLGGPHYALKTHEAVYFARKRNVKVIALVTDYANPVVEHADVVLTAYPTSQHYSIVSVITVLEVLIAALGRADKNQALDKIKTLAEVLSDYKITL